MGDSPAVRALAELAATMDTTGAQLHELAERARALAAEIRDGRRWREAVSAEERPLIVEQLTGVLDALAHDWAAFRRAEARELHQEGLSHERIAALFGVTRQRVGALLAEPVPGTGRRRSATGAWGSRPDR